MSRGVRSGRRGGRITHSYNTGGGTFTPPIDTSEWSTSKYILVGASVVAFCIIGGYAISRLQRTYAPPIPPRIPRNLHPTSRGGFLPKMTRLEAAQIIGVNENALTRAELAKEYRRVMWANHPDRSGSPYLALKINEAKNLLDPLAT